MVPNGIWSFCWVEIWSRLGSNIRTTFELSCLNFTFSFFMIQSSWLWPSLKPCQRHSLFHPWVVIKILRQKPLFQVMNRIDQDFSLLSIFIELFIYIKLIFLSKIVEFCFNMRLVVFILVSSLRLQWKFSSEPLRRLFAVTVFLLWENSSTCLYRRGLFW